MRVLSTIAILFCFVGDCRANSSASTSYESHTEVTWGHSESGSSHGEMRRGQQRRANRKARRSARHEMAASHGSAGSTSYAVAAPVAPEAAPIACAACVAAPVCAPVVVSAAPMYIPVVRARLWRRPVAVMSAPVCVTGLCPQ